MKLKIRKIDSNVPDLIISEKGDLIDLRVSHLRICKNNKEEIEEIQSYDRDMVNQFEYNKKQKYKAGDVLIMRLGFAMEMPIGYKANVYPRSGTFKNYGFILTNSVGQIDNIYKGENDEWCAMFLSTRDGKIEQYDRVLQFEVVESMMRNEVELFYVDNLENDNRGGYSSTGVK